MKVFTEAQWENCKRCPIDICAKYNEKSYNRFLFETETIWITCSCKKDDKYNFIVKEILNKNSYWNDRFLFKADNLYECLIYILDRYHELNLEDTLKLMKLRNELNEKEESMTTDKEE